MKKILAIALTALLLVSLCMSTGIFAFAADENVLEWVCWTQDGSEVTVNKVKTNPNGLVTELSKNWEIKAQTSQSKITDTYWSPATVWTKDTTKDFELVWNVVGDTEVEVGFLHCVGATGSGVTIAVDRDGSQLAPLCKLYWSADGDKWEEIDTDILPQENALVPGMEGFDDEVKPYNGNGVDEYSEDYFVISGKVGATAKYVKYWYKAGTRSNSWDPCVRDAVFTAPKGTEIEVSSTEPVSEEEVSTGDSRYTNVALGATYAYLSGSVREDNFGDVEFKKLTDGVIAADGGSDQIGTIVGDTGEVVFDLGAKADDLKKFGCTVWYGSWGIAEPISVEYFVSDDNVNFTSVGTVAVGSNAVAGTGEGDWKNYDFTLELDKVTSGRYVKMAYTSVGYWWTSEVEIYTFKDTGAVSEEASSNAPATSTPTTEPSKAPITGDFGWLGMALVAVLACAGVAVVRKNR